MKEVWLPVKGFRGHYDVSSYGRVRSNRRVILVRTRGGKWAKRTIRTRFLKPITRNGYLCVGLYRVAGLVQLRIHRLVAEAFLVNPDSKPEVNHIDNDSTNNHVDNLEWATQKENIEHAVKQGRMPKGHLHGRAKITPQVVRVIRRRYAAGGISQTQLGKIYGITNSVVSKIIARVLWSHVD